MAPRMQADPGGRFPYELHVLVCTGPRCNAEGKGEEIRQDLKALNKELGNRARVRVCSVSCLDLCEKGPNLVLWPDGQSFGAQTKESARELYLARVAAFAPAVS